MLDGALAHDIHVVEQVGALAGGVVEHGAVVGLLVGDGLGVVPGLGSDGVGLVAAGKLAGGDKRDLHGGGAADDLGKQAGHVVEVCDGAQAAVVPGAVGGVGPHDGAGLVFLDQALMHGGADGLDLERHERVVVKVEGVAEGRHEDDGARRPGLVVVVHDLRVPLAEEDARDIGRLRHVVHVEVAVVVVADVLGPKARGALAGAVEDALGGVGLAHVPLGDEVVSVGIVEDEQRDVVVEEAHRFGVGAGVELVDGLDELGLADGLRGMQAAVDPDDGLAFFGERVGLVFRKAFGMGELGGDLLVVVEFGNVLGRGDDDHVLAAAFSGGPDVDQLHAVGLGGELLEVGGDLVVVGQHVVVAHVEADDLFGCGDVGAGSLRDEQGAEEGCGCGEAEELWGGGQRGLLGALVNAVCLMYLKALLSRLAALTSCLPGFLASSYGDTSE